MNSVERIQEYLQLEAEEETTAKGIEPPAAWPSNEGKIEVRNLTATYAAEVRWPALDLRAYLLRLLTVLSFILQLDPVLKDVSFTVLPHERVGASSQKSLQ
jgi:ABC-type multidrug transport system fused ATPase/permease subunit